MKPLMTVRPRRTWLFSNPGELWEFRGLLARFAARDITLRYRQTVLGVTWVVLQPLLGAGILSFVFGRVANLPSAHGVPYFVFSLAGMVAWVAFSQVTTRASASLVANAQLVSKVFFPRLLLPLSAVVSTMVDVGISMCLLAGLLMWNGVPVSPRIVLFPFWLLVLVLGALGIGAGAGALMVRYRDVQYIVPVAVQFLLFGSPVAYSLDAVPASSQALFKANPLTGLLEAVRWSIFGTQKPSPALIIYSVAASLILLSVGLAFFNRAERSFADVI